MNSKYIYPAIWHLLLENGATHTQQLRLETYLRVKHRGKYYLWRFYRETEWKPNMAYPGTEIIEAIEIFTGEVYRTLLFGKINPKLMRANNGVLLPLLELDTDQRSEAERLMKIINPQK